MAIKIGNEWWTSPTESDSGKLIMVTGRKGVEEAKESGRYNIRVEITWKYPGDKSGMPDTPTATIMEAVQDAMMQTFKKVPVAVRQAYIRATENATGCFTPNRYIFLSRK